MAESKLDKICWLCLKIPFVVMFILIIIFITTMAIRMLLQGILFAFSPTWINLFK
jgi:low affinity Fe/Cu permease